MPEATPLRHVIDRLRTAEVVADPYPHYYLERVFPDVYYGALLDHLPAGAVYQNLYEVTDLKLDHFRHRDQRDFNDGWTETLSPEMKEFWDSFHRWFLGPELARAVLDSFAAFANGWPEVSVESQLIRHRAGYFLGPHSDASSKLAVLLLYLPRDGRTAHLGTSLYRPKQAGFGCPESRHYPFEDFVRVETAPYKPNSALAFLRSDVSFHGVEPLTEADSAICGRDVIQYVVYDKAARIAQLEKRRLAAARGAA